MAYSLNIISQPVASGTGRVMPVSYVVEVLNSGVRDTAFTGNISAAKQTGTGTAGGTTTVACVAGVATFNALSMSSTGNHTIRFTDATHGTTVDSATLDVVPAASSLLDQYRTIAMRDPVYGTLQHFEIMIPSGLNLANPCGVFVGSNQAGYNNNNAGGGVTAGPARLRTDLGWFQWINANKSTFPFLSVAFPFETGSDDDKRGWHEAMNGLQAYLLALFGIPQDPDNVHLTGYSTGGITVQVAAAKFPTLYAYLSGIDASFTSSDLTHNGAGPDSYGPLDGVAHDAPALDNTLLWPALASVLVNSRCGMALFRGTTAIGPGTGKWLDDGIDYFTPYNRDIRDYTPLLNAIDTAAGSAICMRVTGSTTASQLSGSTPRFYAERFNGTTHTHDQMATAVYNSTDAPKLLALHVANPRRPVSVTFPVPSPARASGASQLLL